MKTREEIASMTSRERSHYDLAILIRNIRYESVDESVDVDALIDLIFRMSKMDISENEFKAILKEGVQHADSEDSGE